MMGEAHGEDRLKKTQAKCVLREFHDIRAAQPMFRSSEAIIAQNSFRAS
jgi:hypothetical protein